MAEGGVVGRAADMKIVDRINFGDGNYHWHG